MSQKTERCPKCMGVLEDDGTCSCGYRRVAKQQAVSLAELCSWNDYGRSCAARGIINTGKWYCREHWLRLNNLEPEGTGNYLPKPSARSLHMRQWDGWTYNPKTKRLERQVSDELLDMIPEEATQA